jgi:hypothetical protein
MRKHWSVTVVRPLTGRDRVHVCIRYIIFAETAKEAEDAALERELGPPAFTRVKPMMDDGEALVFMQSYGTWTKEELAQALGVPPAPPKPPRVAKISNRPLGETQRACLQSLAQHGSYPGGWLWDTDSNTVRILDGLCRRLLVDKVENKYSITQAGRDVLAWGKEVK